MELTQRTTNKLFTAMLGGRKVNVDLIIEHNHNNYTYASLTFEYEGEYYNAYAELEDDGTITMNLDNTDSENTCTEELEKEAYAILEKVLKS